MNLTPWDVQSKQIYTTDGVAPSLYAGECRWGGGEMYILAVHEADGHDDTDGTERPGWGRDAMEQRRNIPYAPATDEAS